MSEIAPKPQKTPEELQSQTERITEALARRAIEGGMANNESPEHGSVEARITADGAYVTTKKANEDEEITNTAMNRGSTKRDEVHNTTNILKAVSGKENDNEDYVEVIHSGPAVTKYGSRPAHTEGYVRNGKKPKRSLDKNTSVHASAKVLSQIRGRIAKGEDKRTGAQAAKEILEK